MHRFHMAASAAAIAALFCSVLTAAAVANDRVVVGKAVPIGFIFMPVDIGVKAGIFAKDGFDVEVQGLAGDAKLNQAMAAGSVDIGIGGATDLAFEAKGSPTMAVAAMSNSAAWLGLIVPAQSPIATVKDLRGKRIAVTTPSSLTYYVVRELSRQQGWGPDGIVTVPLGAPSTYLAALKAGQVDGATSSIENGYALEEKHEGRVLLSYGVIGPVESMAVFATDAMVEKRPEVLRRFLKSWFETIAYLKMHRAEALAIMKGPYSDAAEEKVYDRVVESLSSDGKFPPEAMEKLGKSFAELGLVEPDAKVDLASLYTEKFLPGSE